MTVHSSGEPLETVLTSLRAEQALEQNAPQQALLRHECGVIEEARGDDKAAAREYLAAYNADPEFREPLEALVRLFARQRDDKHLPKLLDALVDAAYTPGESGRAYWELAAYKQDVEHDLAGARNCLERAVELDPADAACWLELELCVDPEDKDARMRALEARAELTQNPTWQGLLLIEVAGMCADAEDFARAFSLLDQVAALEGRARFASRLALEAVARRANELDMAAHALEGQAELILAALEDPEFGDRAGVPRFARQTERAADAWLRASELHRLAGDPSGALAALAAASERLPNSTLIGRMRVAAADATGDGAGAVAAAQELLDRGVTGPAAAALWIRLGMQAGEAGDLGGALQSFGRALAIDPRSAPALALGIDLLGRGDDQGALAAALEAAAASAPTDEVRANGWLVVAYVWAHRARDLAKAKAALAKAATLGAPGELVARITRSLAALCVAGTRGQGEAHAAATAWYEEATRALVELVPDQTERASLWFELGRLHLLRGEGSAASAAFDKLAACGSEENGAAWLGRALIAYSVGLGSGNAHAPDAVAALAEVQPDADLKRGLLLVAALLASREGAQDRARAILQAEHEREPENLVVALFLADLCRRLGDVAAAAATLARTGAACEEGDVGGALGLEAALLQWRAGAREQAVRQLELVMERAPDAASLVLGWALRAAAPDDLASRRRALELSVEALGESDLVALERLGLAFAEKRADEDVLGELDRLEQAGSGDIALSGAVGRLLWWDGMTEREPLERATHTLEQQGGSLRAIARAEQLALARADGAVVARLRTARAWAEAEPGAHTALEWLAAAVAAEDRGAETEARWALMNQLEGSARAAIEASAVTATLVDQPGLTPGLLHGDADETRLTNLELAAPGSDPRRRATVLRGIGDALGADAARDAAAMAAWSDVARGAYGEAKGAFLRLVEAHPDDVAAWEGLRVSAEHLGDHLTTGRASARLGTLCKDDARAGAFWEAAGMILLEKTQAHDDAETALGRALDRDPTRELAFDKLFRRVRGRGDDDRLLKLIARRLEVSSDDAEITKMYWERARVLHKKGDVEGALGALNDVTLLEPDHVGALVLAGDINFKKGDFAKAAPLFARLSSLSGASREQRLNAARLAVKIYETDLKTPEKALEVLLRVHADGLSTLPVRERLATIAARVGQWDEATRMFERLMEERDNAEGRIDAARTAMRIYRDKLREPKKADNAVARLLREAPDDAEAIEMVLRGGMADGFRMRAIPVAKRTLLKKLAQDPFDTARIGCLADIARTENDAPLRRTTLGCLVALGQPPERARAELDEIETRMPQAPEDRLDQGALLEIGDPSDTGPLPELFAQIAQTVSLALGPSLKSEGVGRKQRLDSGPERMAVSRWMAALGVPADFELYVGGREERGVRGIAGEQPAVILGTAIRAPFDGPTRAALAREVFALRRGTTAVLRCDDNTIASIAFAVAIATGVRVAEPKYAAYPEVARSIHRELPRKLKNALGPLCQRWVDSGQDPHGWAEAARRSIDRMGLIAAGDVSLVIDEVLGGRGNLKGNPRARDILAFALSPELLALRAKFGMGGG
ncbi:MAG: hypothetical protein HY908_14430 [Myxococcales bacterium]|nr:hypothetical protein [Myxococcales bacterium]